MDGLLTNKADGSPRWSVFDRTSRTSGIITIPNYNGSVAVPTNGTPFWKFNNADASENAVRPVISVSGSTIFWTWSSPGAGFNAANCTLIVGVY